MRRSVSSGRVDGGNLSHLDLDCKEALQKLLRPSYYGIINPWMGSASTRQKQDMILLKKRMEEADRPGKNPYFMADVGKIQITSNPSGRERESNVIPVTADRIQADLLRNQSGAEQRDVRREKERRYMARYHEIPSTSSVADFFQLSQSPVLEHPTMKVLTDRVRGKLKHWQVLGPEQNPHEAAEMMRGLQALAAACDRLPSYGEYSATSSKQVHERLFGYSQVVPRGNRTLKEVPKLRRAPLSSSAPILLRPLMDPSELDAISRPGGTVCKLKDCEPLQRMKNIARSSQSQVQMSMGPTDWSTTSRDMAKDYS